PRSARRSTCCCRGSARRGRFGRTRRTTGENAMTTRGLVDPELLEMLETMPSFEMTHETLILAREGMASVLVPLDTYARPEVEVEERKVPGPKGAPDVGVLIYRPTNVA